MLANGIKQSATGTTGNLTLATIGAWPPFSAKFVAGAGGVADDIPYGIVRDSDGITVEWGIGHLADAATFVRDRTICTWNGTAYVDLAPTAADLSTGGTYTLQVADNASLRVLPPAGTNSAVAATRYLTPAQWNANPGATYTMTAGTSFGVPFRLDVPLKCTGIAFKLQAVATTGTTKHARCALYRMDRNGNFGVLLAEGANVDVSVGAATVKISTFSTVNLDPGWYGVVIIADGNPGILSTNAANGAGAFQPWGCPGGDPTGRYASVFKTITYADTGTMFPNPYGTTGLTFNADWASLYPLATVLVGT